MSRKLAKLIKYNKHNHQASKSASSKYLGRRLGDRPLLPSSIANVATGTFAVLMLSLAIPAFLTSSTTYAEPYALSISFVDSSSNEDISSPTMELNVSPSKNGTFSKSNTSTIGVGTTSATGYTLSIAASNSNGDKLVNSSDSDTNTNYISSISSAITEEQFKALPSDGSSSKYNNQWGYLPSMWNGASNNLFRPAPTTAGHVLNSTSGANAVASATATDVCKRYACDKYDLTVGARVDVSQKIGSYSNTYVVYATANGTPYTIVFKDDTVSGMPSDISSNSASSTVTIPNDLSKPTRDGYSFIGWCSGTVSHNANGTDTCSGTVYQNGSTWAITEGVTTNNLTLYAMWSGNYTIDALTSNGNTLYMQDFANMSAEKKAKVISSMATETNYTVKDSRDNQDYTIAKLKDGQIWMTKNLNIAGGTTLSYENTDYSAIWSLPTANGFQSGNRLPASSSSGFDSGSTAYVYNTETTACNNSDPCYSYYSWTTATLGSGVNITTDNLDAPYSICPKGWKLPTSRSFGKSSDWGNLAMALGTPDASLRFNDSTSPTAANLFSELNREPYNFMRAGEYVNGQFDNPGAVMWSSTANPSNAYSLHVTYGLSNFRNSAHRRAGLAVRCLLK